MSNINDLFTAALVDLGYTENYNDAIFAYLGDQGCTGNINDRWKCWLSSKGYSTLYDYLVSLGYSGNINDMLKESLVDGAFFELLPKFTAAVMDADTGEMKLLDVGTGPATSTHTATIYAPDHEGVYQAFAANEPVWSGARISGGTAYGTDALGDPLASAPFLVYQPLASNRVTDSRDLQAAGWTLVGAPTESYVTGIDGSASAASKAVDTAGGAYYTTAVNCSANDTVTIVRWIKKDATATTFTVRTRWRNNADGTNTNGYFGSDDGATGTGDSFDSSVVVDDGDWWKVIYTIDDNGSADTSTLFVYVSGGNAAGTGPDGAVLGWNENDCISVFLNMTAEQVRYLGPIFNSGAADSTDAVAPAWTGSNIDDAIGAIYCEWRSPIADTEATGNLEILSTTTGASLLYYDATNNDFRSTDGTNTISAGGAIAAGTTYRLGVIWDATAGTMRLAVDGVWGTEGTYDGAWEGSSLIAGRATAYAAAIRQINGYSGGTYAVLQDKIEERMISDGMITDELGNLITDESGVYLTWE